MSLAVVTLWHDRVLLNFLAHAEYNHSAILPAGKYPWDWDIVSKKSQLQWVCFIFVFYAIPLSHWKSWLWGEEKKSALAFYSVLLNTAIMYLNSLHLYGSMWVNIHVLKVSAFREHCHGLWCIIFCKDRLQLNVSITWKFTGLIKLIWLGI